MQSEQEFLVRGLFLEEDADDEEAEDEDVAEPNTYWVTRADLLDSRQLTLPTSRRRSRSARSVHWKSWPERGHVQPCPAMSSHVQPCPDTGRETA